MKRISALYVLLLSCVICILVLAGCSKKSQTSTSGASSVGMPSQFRDLRNLPGTVFDVTYTSNTVRIDLPTVQRTLQSLSEDGRVFVFDASDPGVRQLAEGKVMFLEHLGVRRVLAVQAQNSQIAILTESAALTDFIQDGDIQFSVPINFSELQDRTGALPKPVDSLTSRIGSWLALPVAHADGAAPKISVHTKGEINDWEFEITGEPHGDGLSLSLQAAKKKLAGLTASITAKCELQHVSTAFKVLIHGGKMQNFEYSTPIQGHLNVSWAVLTKGANSGIGEARLKLPPFAKQVFDIYGIPFLFKIDEALIFKPGFGGNKDAAEGGFHVTYDGSGGLAIRGEQSSPQGAINAEPAANKTTAESLAAHGVVLAINAPKVSVSLGTESMKEAIKAALPADLGNKVADFLAKGPFGLRGLVKSLKDDFFKIEGAAYLQLVTEFDYAGSGPLSIVPCSMTHLNFYAQAGADATLFALKGESPKLNLKEAKLTFREPDINACGQK